jgi:hypothetical protein
MCDLEAIGAPEIFRLYHATTLVSMLPTFDLSRSLSKPEKNEFVDRVSVYPKTVACTSIRRVAILNSR